MVNEIISWPRFKWISIAESALRLCAFDGRQCGWRENLKEFLFQTRAAQSPKFSINSGGRATFNTLNTFLLSNVPILARVSRFRCRSGRRFGIVKGGGGRS